MGGVFAFEETVLWDMVLRGQVHYLRASTSSHATTWYSTQGMPDTGARRISGDGVITPAT